MTLITRMDMKGFKSFGKKVSMEFGPGFNCILGPNGSGKSNVTDALCFVLGKGSAKGLRAEKSANLIYNGGKKKEPAGQGEVSIFFDNSKKTFPSEESFVKITRVIKKSGQSVYKINDKTRTKQQILDLLAIANIDPDGYNIVLQGDIMKLIEMAPNERRLLVEDIAGISIYEEKKDKAIKELEKVDQKINEAEIILTERKTYLKDLKKDRDQALQYKDISESLQRNKATLVSLQIKSREEKNEGVLKAINSHEENLKKLQNEIASLKKTVEDKRAEALELTKEIEEKGENDQVRIMKEIEQMRIDIATNRTKISSNEGEMQRVAVRKEQLKADLRSIEKKIADLNQQKNELEKKIADNEKQARQLKNKIDDFKKKNKIEDTGSIDLDIDRLDKEAEEKNREVQELREKQQSYLREEDKIKIYLATIEDRIRKVLEIEKEHKKDLEILKNRKEEFKKATLELNRLLNEDSSLAAQLGNARQKLISAEEELSKLNAKNIGIKQKVADSIAIKTILESKDRFGKVYGLVSELGTVSEKYSLALEISAGNRIKSIVVDTDKTAAECINFLKKNRLGTATFLPLNKMRDMNDKSGLSNILKSSGVLGLASDIIVHDSKFNNIFSYVFGGTVIVESIEVARRIGIGAAKMVTLDGDLVEKSGAMHGGFRQKAKGSGFAEKEVAEGISEKEKLASDMQTLVKKLEGKRLDAEEKIGRLRTLKATLEGEIIKIEKSLHLDSGDLEAGKKEKKEKEAELLNIGKGLEEANKNISGVNSELARIKIKRQELKNRITELKNPRVIAELNTFEEKVTELNNQRISYESDMKNIGLQIKNILEPDRESTTKIITQQDKELDGFKSEQAALKEKIKADEKKLIEKEKMQKEFYGKYRSLFTKKDKLNEFIQKEEAKIIKTEEGARAVEQKMNILSIDNASLKAQLSAFQEEYEKYKNVELVKGRNEEELKKEVWSLERKIEAAGNINMRALELYDNIEKEYNSLIDKQQKLKSEKEDVIVMINEIDTKKKELFMKTFEKMDAEFRKMFSQLSTKGEAFLELENPKDPLSEGLCIRVRISGKKFLDIRSLSGGEKTMTALAFIFAIQEFEPASFYIFDEVDSALDKRNSEKLADLMKKYSEKAQYIIISHNDGIINSADTLYGVSMDENSMSKIYSVSLNA